MIAAAFSKQLGKLINDSWQGVPGKYVLTLICSFLLWEVMQAVHGRDTERQARLATEIESLRAGKDAEMVALNDRITELSRKPYTEDLKRITEQVLDHEMTLERPTRSALLNDSRACRGRSNVNSTDSSGTAKRATRNCHAAWLSATSRRGTGSPPYLLGH
jgi:hypothetical protein